jgi:amidohydrolase family protein
VKAPSPGPAGAFEHPLVIRGGRVVDPARSLDASADVAIEDAHIVAVGRGRVVLDATGCVVAPGFIDLHSHAQTVVGNWLQAFDGVTTALELEAGASPVAAAYAQAASTGRPLNYGYSASWAIARIEVLTGRGGDPSPWCPQRRCGARPCSNRSHASGLVASSASTLGSLSAVGRLLLANIGRSIGAIGGLDI